MKKLKYCYGLVRNIFQNSLICSQNVCVLEVVEILHGVCYTPAYIYSQATPSGNPRESSRSCIKYVESAGVRDNDRIF